MFNDILEPLSTSKRLNLLLLWRLQIPLLLLLGADSIASAASFFNRKQQHHHQPRQSSSSQPQGVPGFPDTNIMSTKHRHAFHLYRGPSPRRNSLIRSSRNNNDNSDNNHDDDRSISSSSSSSSSGSGVRRFLGRGPRAIVREGVVLVAPQHEYHHYYRRSAIFIYNIGLPDDESSDSSSSSTSSHNYVIRGLILDHPTPFTWKEMIPGRFDDSPLGDALLYRGGDRGGDGVLLLHNNKIQHAAADNNNNNNINEIGPGSGIYQGGWDAAVAAVHAGTADVEDFKAFFNFCEFSELELEAMLESEEGGDGWASVEVDSNIVLSTDWDRGGCWKRLRNAIAQHMQQS